MVLVSAPFGTGKSTLVRAVREDLAERGWLLVPQDREAVVAGPDATVEELRAEIEEQLHETLRRAAADQAFVAPAAGHSRRTAPEPAVSSLLTGAALTDEASGAEHETVVSGPVLLIVEAQAPPRPVRDWLTGPAGVGQSAPIALIVTTDRVEEELQRSADLLVRLGPLDRAAVAQRLDEVCPGLPAGEIAAYADAISRDPTTLDSFLRLLPLAGASADADDGTDTRG
jgi:hypothetical protein